MSKATKNKVTRELLRRALRILSLDKGKQYVVLVKTGTILSTKDSINRFASAMAHSDINGVVCVVRDFNDLTILDEYEMEKFGWMRIPESTNHQVNDLENSNPHQDQTEARLSL